MKQIIKRTSKRFPYKLWQELGLKRRTIDPSIKSEVSKSEVLIC